MHKCKTLKRWRINITSFLLSLSGIRTKNAICIRSNTISFIQCDVLQEANEAKETMAKFEVTTKKGKIVGFQILAKTEDEEPEEPDGAGTAKEIECSFACFTNLILGSIYGTEMLATRKRFLDQ